MACLLLLSMPVIGQNVIEYTNPSQLLLVGKNISYVKDVHDSLQIEDVCSPAGQQLFQQNHKDVFSRPGTESAFWFKIIVQNEAAEDLWLELASNYAWVIDFYSPDSLGRYHQPIQSGTMRPAKNKLYDVNYFWLPLNKSGERQHKTFYFKVKSGLTFDLPMHVGSIRALTKNKSYNDYMVGGFLGIVLIMLLYNLFIFLSIKDKIYLYYIGYLFVMLFSMPYANGNPFIEHIQIGFLDKYFWNHYFLVWHTPAYFFIGMFCIKYLELERRKSVFRRIIQAEILIVSGVFPLLNLAGIQVVDLVNAVQICIMILYLTCLFAGYYYAFRGIREAYIYSLGWTFLITGVIVFFAVINGFAPYNTFSRNIMYIGTAAEVCLFALALADRMNQLQKEKDHIKSENLQLVNEQNIKLEKEVANRTAQLKSTNSELVQSNEELKLTTEQLDQQAKKLYDINQTKDRLFAIISHDLRSPINSLRGLLGLIHGGDISKDEFIQFSQDVKDGVEHTHFLLNNLLNWAKFQMEGMSTQPSMIVLKPVVSENVALFHETIIQKNITIANKVDDKTELFADHDHVNLIIRNLLSNAIKFSNPGDTITIASEKTGDTCKVSIADTGVGMSSETRKNLFSSDAIKSTKGTSGEKGTGLGLTLCRDFMTKNNGTIMVETAVGKGSTFYLEFPGFAPAG